MMLQQYYNIAWHYNNAILLLMFVEILQQWYNIVNQTKQLNTT